MNLGGGIFYRLVGRQNPESRVPRDFKGIIHPNEMLEISAHGPFLQTLRVASDANLHRTLHVYFHVRLQLAPVEIPALLVGRDCCDYRDDFVPGEKSRHHAQHTADLDAFLLRIAEKIAQFVANQFSVQDLDALAPGTQETGQRFGQRGHARPAEPAKPDRMLVVHDTGALEYDSIESCRLPRDAQNDP